MSEHDNDKRAIPSEAADGAEAGNQYVSFVEDPYGINTIEISEAQQNQEELILDEGLDETMDVSAPIADLDATLNDWIPDGDAAADEALPELKLNTDDSQLDNLARAMAEEQTRQEESLQAIIEASAEDNDAKLAAQIAEDEALTAQLALESAEQQKLLETDPELLAALPTNPQPDENGNLDLSELQSCIETLLFMTDKPVSTTRLKEWLGPDFNSEVFEAALAGLKERYQGMHHGFELAEVANGWQFRTKPGRAALAKKLAKVQTQRLSSGGMESLAIIAFRQPVLKDEIDKIRGVDSSYFIRGLLDKRLIAITGRSELPGRPMLYSTTDSFLELFGLKDLTQLPPLRELEQMIPTSQSSNPADEDPRVKEMRRLVGQMKSDTSTTLKYDPHEDERILKEIRERITSIQTSTPYLDEQKEAEKQAKLAAKNPQPVPPVGTQLDLGNQSGT